METQKQGVIPEEAETTKELLGVQESSTRETKEEKNRTQERGKETGGKRGGNESAETRGGPALIP